MDELPFWLELLEQVRIADTAAAVMEIMSAVTSREEDVKWRVISTGLDRLIDLDYGKIEPLIIEHSLMHSEFTASVLHGRLAKWLRDDAPDRRSHVVDTLARVIAHPELAQHDESWPLVFQAAVVVSGLASTEVRRRNAIWAALEIGFRAELLDQCLVNCVRAEYSPEVQQHALWGLVYLGYPNVGLIEASLQPFLRADAIDNEFALRCVRKLALPSFLDAVLAIFRERSTLPTPDNASDQPKIDILYAMASIAETHPDLSARVWDEVLLRADAFAGILDFWGGIAECIDDQRVADYFVHKLTPMDPHEFEAANAISPHHRLYLKLSHLSTPRQLAGIHGTIGRADTIAQKHIIEAMRLDATPDTGNISMFQTGVSMLKERCWGALLMINPRYASNWVVEVLNEHGAFAASDVCKLAGYFRCKEAVPQLREWVSRDDWDEEGGLHIFLGLAALEALGNIGTYESFNALMDSHVTFAGRNKQPVLDSIPQNYVSAIVAAVTTMQDAGMLITRLESGISDGNQIAWVGCAGAVDEVARRKPGLVAPHRHRILKLLLTDDARSANYQHYFISALGYTECSDAGLEEIVAAATNGKNERIKLAGLTALACWDELLNHPGILSSIRIVRTEDGKWSAESNPTYDVARISGVLYWHHRKEFADVIAAIIRDGSPIAVNQVAAQLPKECDDAVIIQALVDRINSDYQRFQVESEVFWALTRSDPARFLAEFGHSVVCAWRPEARQITVNCYRGIAESTFDKGLRESAVSALEDLLCDPSPVVRRSAGRSLAQFEPGAVNRESLRLFGSTDVQTRCYGLDASVWLQDEALYAAMQAWGSADREMLVRRYADTANDRRRDVGLTREYLEPVLSCPADELLSVCHYAQALRKVGDDEALMQITSTLNHGELQPNKRAFLTNLRDDISKSWEKQCSEREDRLKG